MNRYMVWTGIFLVLLMAATVSAGDSDLHYQPYGFRFPLLEKGEYVISALGNYYKWENDAHYEDPLPRGLDFEAKQYYVTVRGAVAVSDRLLVEASCMYYPSQRTEYTRRWSTDTSDSTTSFWAGETDYEGFFSPTFALAFRPVVNLEFQATINHSSSRTNSNNDPPSIWDVIGQTRKHVNLTVGMTYHGRL